MNVETVMCKIARKHDHNLTNSNTKWQSFRDDKQTIRAMAETKAAFFIPC
jgi:hypothetical protein